MSHIALGKAAKAEMENAAKAKKILQLCKPRSESWLGVAQQDLQDGAKKTPEERRGGRASALYSRGAPITDLSVLGRWARLKSRKLCIRSGLYLYTPAAEKQKLEDLSSWPLACARLCPCRMATACVGMRGAAAQVELELVARTEDWKGRFAKPRVHLNILGSQFNPMNGYSVPGQPDLRSARVDARGLFACAQSTPPPKSRGRAHTMDSLPSASPVVPNMSLLRRRIDDPTTGESLNCLPNSLVQCSFFFFPSFCLCFASVPTRFIQAIYKELDPPLNASGAVKKAIPKDQSKPEEVRYVTKTIILEDGTYGTLMVAETTPQQNTGDSKVSFIKKKIEDGEFLLASMVGMCLTKLALKEIPKPLTADVEMNNLVLFLVAALYRLSRDHVNGSPTSDARVRLAQCLKVLSGSKDAKELKQLLIDSESLSHLRCVLKNEVEEKSTLQEYDFITSTKQNAGPRGEQDAPEGVAKARLLGGDPRRHTPSVMQGSIPTFCPMGGRRLQFEYLAEKVIGWHFGALMHQVAPNNRLAAFANHTAEMIYSTAPCSALSLPGRGFPTLCSPRKMGFTLVLGPSGCGKTTFASTSRYDVCVGDWNPDAKKGAFGIRQDHGHAGPPRGARKTP
eukprot:gene224-725_t